MLDNELYGKIFTPPFTITEVPDPATGALSPFEATRRVSGSASASVGITIG
jgi:hypothetical protein